MHKSSKLLRLIVLLIVTVMVSSQVFGIVVYARGSSKASSHSSSSRSSGSRSTTSKSSTTKSTPSSGAKSGSFSASPKSSSTVGSSATKSSTSPKSSTKPVYNNNNNTVVVNNHTYVSHPSNGFLFMHRSYYVDDYGSRHYTSYRPNFGGLFLGIIVVVIILFAVKRIKNNNRY